MDWVNLDTPQGGFSIQRYVASSRPLDLEGVQWDRVPEKPLESDLRRALTFFIDIENQTIMYLRDLLAAGAANDPDVATFLPCWGYEEMFHGRALERFLNQYGIQLEPDRLARLRKKVTLRERLEAIGSRLLARYHRHFPAVYLSWGAMQEISTLMAYHGLVRKADHPVLTDIIGRIIKDESRHFSFYYHMAQRKLVEPAAQKLARFVLRRFWTPVGQGVKPESEVRWIQAFTMDGALGQAAISQIDRIINKLPGLEKINLLTRYSRTLAPPAARPFAPLQPA